MGTKTASKSSLQNKCVDFLRIQKLFNATSIRSYEYSFKFRESIVVIPITHKEFQLEGE